MEEDDTKPAGPVTAKDKTTIDDLRGWIRNDLGDFVEGSEEFDAVLVMLTALFFTDTEEGVEEQIAKLTAVLPERVGKFARRLREADIWASGGTNAENVHAWRNEESGWFALYTDALVAVGRLTTDGETYRLVPSPPPVQSDITRRKYFRSAVLRKLILDAMPKVETAFTAARILSAIKEKPKYEQLDRHQVGRELLRMTKDGLLSVTPRGPLCNLYRSSIGTNGEDPHEAKGNGEHRS